MRECCTPCVVQYADWVYFFQSNAPRAGCNRGTPPRQAACRISINAPHAGCDGGGFCLQGQVRYFNLMHPMRGATKGCTTMLHRFQSNAPRARCNSKTIQFKRILVARKMYSFANYVLHTLKHSPIYCIGTTLQPLIFGAMLPVILCQLNVRTILITLLYHTSLLPASAFAAIKSHRPNGVMRVKYT